MDIEQLGKRTRKDTETVLRPTAVFMGAIPKQARTLQRGTETI